MSALVRSSLCNGVKADGSACRCTNTKTELRNGKGLAPQPASAAGPNCCECGHEVFEHFDAPSESARENAGADVLAVLSELKAANEKIAAGNEKIVAGNEKIAADNEKILESLSHKRREVSMSGIDSDSWRELEASGFKLVPEVWPAGLSDKLVAGAPAGAVGAAADAPFKWGNENENQQAAKYTEYMHACLSPLPDTVCLIEAPSGLLTTKSRLLPFNVKGTADLLLVEQASLAAGLEASGIHAVIELKKDLATSNSRARHQAMLELIVADLSSHFLPFALLSDLNDSFLFFWLNEKKERALERQIHFLVAPSRKLAFLLLKRLIAQCSRVEEEIRAANAYLDTLGVGIHKRRKLSVIAEQRGPHGDKEPEESDWHSADGPSWDEEDMPMLLRRQVRKAIRNTPFLMPYTEPPFTHAIQHAMFV